MSSAVLSFLPHSKSFILLKLTPFPVPAAMTLSLVFIARHSTRLLPLFSLLRSKWSVSLRKLRSLSMNSVIFALKSPYLPYFCPFQISWFSEGPHFVKNLRGSCLAIKCPLCLYVYHQSFRSLPSPLPSSCGHSGKTKSIISTPVLHLN